MPADLRSSGQVPQAVIVRAPARLHLGFIDPGATLGRRFGSIGLVIDEPATHLVVCPAESDQIAARHEHEAARLADHLDALRRATGRRAPLQIELQQALPAHAGLGSGTQLALALGRAFATCFDMPLTTSELTALLGRGLRSGIGAAGFDDGGFLVDGGPAADSGAAPVLFRRDFPTAWRVLLVRDPSLSGLHGADEQRALAALPTFSREHAACVSHELLMRVLPGLAEVDFAPFARGISSVQQLIGAHFAPAQGGSAYTSPRVERLLRWVEANSQAGVGQSSWGPTGFALLPSAETAAQLLDAARGKGIIDPRLAVRIVGGRNRGADITHSPIA